MDVNKVANHYGLRVEVVSGYRAMMIGADIAAVRLA